MSQSESRRVAHCMYVEIELKKKRKKFLILKVWFYENSVKFRQSPTHERENGDLLTVASCQGKRFVTSGRD